MRASTLRTVSLSLLFGLVVGCGGGGGGGSSPSAPLALEAYAKASNTEAGDAFGYTVSVSGDTMVVGAPAEDSLVYPQSGAAYVFVRSGTTWAQQAYLKASNNATGDGFGASVSISGDTIVVGSEFEDSSATGVDGNQADDSAVDSGAAYVFVRTGTTWTQQAYLKASNAEAEDGFGTSVSISGNTIVVGAPHERSSDTGVDGNQADNSAVEGGAGYVFARVGGTWTQTAYLKASNTDAGDQFGFCVAVSDDTVVVGSAREDSNARVVNGNEADNSGSGRGAAYVFARTGPFWTQQAYLKASNAGALNFGFSAAISGDTIVVGALDEGSNATGVNGNQADNSAPSSGAAYVFVRTGTTWTLEAYLKASNTGAGDNFGRAVAISGDALVVGALNESSDGTGVDGSQANDSATQSGAAYLFVRTGAAWEQRAYLKASNTDPADWFGIAVSISNGTIAVGAIAEDSAATGVDGNEADDSASESGAVYVFR